MTFKNAPQNQKGTPGKLCGAPGCMRPQAKGGAGKCEEHLRAIAAADQENAKRRDQRAASSDGMTAAERAVASSKPKPKPAKKELGCKRRAADGGDLCGPHLAELEREQESAIEHGETPPAMRSRQAPPVDAEADEDPTLFPELDLEDPVHKAIFNVGKRLEKARRTLRETIKRAKDECDELESTMVDRMRAANLSRFRFRGIVAEMKPSEFHVAVKLEESKVEL